jgi:hypothetical protein
MSYFMVDVEADGPIPGRYSMISFGAIVVEPGLQRTFYRRLWQSASCHAKRPSPSRTPGT